MGNRTLRIGTFLSFAIAAAFLLSCSGANDDAGPKPAPRAIEPGVYAAVIDSANTNAATIWKDGEVYPFFDSGSNEKLGWVTSLSVTGDYIGVVCQNSDGMSLWINGVEALRTTFRNGAPENDYPMGLSINPWTGKWYLCGNRWHGLVGSAYTKSDAVLWTDEGSSIMSPATGEVFCEFVNTHMFFDASGLRPRVFLCGRAEQHPAFWKDGYPILLPYNQVFPDSELWLDAWARAVCVSGYEYVVGDVTEFDYGYTNVKSKAVLWKNDDLVRVLEGTGCDIVRASSVYGFDGSVYVIGYEDGYKNGARVSQWLLWKNDEPPVVIGPNFINPTLLLDSEFRPRPHCISDGNVYHAGGAGGRSVLRNGERLFDVNGSLITNIAVLEAPAS
jgi:hypothetical protein